MVTVKEKARTGERDPGVERGGSLFGFCSSFPFGDLKSASSTSKLPPNDLMEGFLLFGLLHSQDSLGWQDKN